MKTLIRLIIGFSLVACIGFAAVAELSNVSFVFGQKKFKDGDGIIIQQVLATSPKFAVGDKVVVRGLYQLKSKEKATLALFLTQTGGDGRDVVSPSQTLEVKEGSGPFELVYTVAHPGALHVTFYSIPNGMPFGGVYFGTEAQMKSVANMPLSDYGR